MLLSFLYLVRAEAFWGLTRAEAFWGLRLMPAPSPFLTGWVLAVDLMYTMLPLGPGDGAADGYHVQLCVDLHHIQILDGDLIHAHVAGLLLAREYAGRISAGAHGTGVTVNGAAAVAGGGYGPGRNALQRRRSPYLCWCR